MIVLAVFFVLRVPQSALSLIKMLIIFDLLFVSNAICVFAPYLQFKAAFTSP